MFGDKLFNYPLRKVDYTKRNRKYVAKLSEEEIIDIRNRYVNETGPEIYKDYKDRISYVSFERALMGRTFKELPIYKKKEKIWINK